jgi:Cu/Ag efflux protein CusF
MTSTYRFRAFCLGALFLVSSLAIVSPAPAMSPGFFGDAADGDTAAAATSDERMVPLVSGKVVSVDAARGRITLEFRPAPQHFLEGGTRIFDVAKTVPLKGLSAGDKVRFDLERNGKRYVVTHVENSN